MSFLEEVGRNIEHMDALSRLSDEELNKLRSEYPKLPQAYLRFLSEVGFGNLGQFQIYSGPIASREVYRAPSKGLVSVILVGDDFLGCCFGFDTADGFRLVEVDPRGNVDKTVAPDFEGYLRGYFSS